VIVGHSSAAQAAKAATTTTPIVFVGDDPFKTGLVASLNRPNGNVTGVSFTTIDVTPKRLGLLSINRPIGPLNRPAFIESS